MKNNKPIGNLEIAKAARPWHPALTQVMTMAAHDFSGVTKQYGVLHKPERATFLHVAVRKALRELCKNAPEFLTLVEEPEGKGLDYVMVNMEPIHFCLRWAISNGIYVCRNRTERSKKIQSQGVFPFHMDDCGGEVTATMTYSLADDYTEIGVPQAWINRLVLGRERTAGFEFIEEIAVFEKMAKREVGEQSDPRIIAWEEENNRLRKIVKETKRKLA